MRVTQKQKIRALRAQSMTAKFLHTLGNFAFGYGLFLTYRGRRALVYYQCDLGVIRREWSRARKVEQLRRLEERGLIRLRKTAEKLEVALTKQGVHEYFRAKVHDADLLPDGYVCMVVFDIPERCRPLRKSLRKFLESAAFMPIQKSVWITPFDAAEPLARLFKDLKDKRWIKIYTAAEKH